MFGFFRRKKKSEAPRDPLQVFDRLIDQLERQAGQLRRSAATLLALQGELTRNLARYELQRKALRERQVAAGTDARLLDVLSRDSTETERLEHVTREALGRAEEDGRVLLAAAEDVAGQVRELKLERTSASVRLQAGSTMSSALEAQVARFDQVVALDAARDEIEKAHHLADIYRSEARRDGSG